MQRQGCGGAAAPVASSAAAAASGAQEGGAVHEVDRRLGRADQLFRAAQRRAELNGRGGGVAGRRRCVAGVAHIYVAAAGCALSRRLAGGDS